jgi:hypothetical protein
MKKNMKYIVGFALCAGLMQPQIQAMGAFKESARKWTARGAAAIYWIILTDPGAAAFNKWNALRKQDQSGSLNRFPDLKSYAPIKYAEANKILKAEGHEGLDGHTIKVVPIEHIECPSAIFNTTILFPDKSIYSSQKNAESVMALSNLDHEEVAAIFRHEQAHQAHNDFEKKSLFKAVTPFGIHALAQGIYNKMVTKSHSDTPPTIKRSLLRIPRAYAVFAAAACVEGWYARICEREADASLKDSPELALKMAGVLNRFAPQRKERYEADLKSLMHSVYPPSINVEENIKKTMQYYEYIDNFQSLFSSHPLESERSAYLKKWAADAEAKKQQEENK